MNIRFPFSRQSGLSLVELMISITLGLFILAGVATIFTNNSRSRQEIERTSRQIENGRYASQLLSDDLQAAGFLGEFDPTPLDTSSLAALPDPCATDLPTLRTAMPLHIQGYDNGAGAPTCLADVKAGTDIFVIRRASTCVAGTANCDPFLNGEPHFQASLCAPATGGYELSFTPSGNADYAAQFYALDTVLANLARHKTNCTTLADIRRYRTHIYFIANNDVAGDGIPTLKRAELGAGGFTIVPLVEGIDNLQLEYGVDSNCDGIPNFFTANPTAYTPQTTYCKPFDALPASLVANWRNVVSVKLNLLARNTESTAGYADTRTYTLGLKADGTANSFGPFNDGFKRHAYTSTVRLGNPAGRRE